jgi:hypothetical protein
MPRRFQHLRLDGTDNPEALVMHWTGPEGKRRIRERISRDAGDTGDENRIQLVESIA